MTDPFRPDHDPAADTTVTTTGTPASVSTSTPAAEPVTPAVATSPVTPPAATSSAPRGRVRWIAGLGIVALVVAASAAVALALTGSSPTAVVTGYAPEDSLVYGEVRLDLPGDQARMVGEFLSHFPGFADQAALDTKLDEVLDRLVQDATDGEQTFSADIKPWFDGEIAFALGALPDAASSDPPAAAAATRGLLLLSIKDAALADAWFREVMTETGATGTVETYDGTEIHVFAEDGSPVAAAFALVDGKVAIAGDLASVKAAIDTNGASGLADTPEFSAASDALTGDHIGFVFVDMQALMDGMLDLAGEASGTAPSDALLALVPEWMGARLRLEADAMVMDAVTPHVDGAPGPDANRATGVDDWAPTGTVALLAGNDYGATLDEVLALYKQDPALAEAIAALEEGAGVLGGLDAITEWIGDAGLVVARDGEVIEGGIIAIPTDGEAADDFFTQIKSFLALAGSGSGLTVREEDHGGVPVTIVSLGSAGDLLGMAGALGGVPVPTDPGTALPSDPIELAWAVTDGVVVIGSGPDFVKSVLDAGAGTSLADDARYQALIGRVGAEHTGVQFLDITAIRELVEAHLADLPIADRGEYEESIKPFLTPFDAYAAATVLDGDVDGQHALITVK